jgi:hypothetical protein
MKVGCTDRLRPGHLDSAIRLADRRPPPDTIPVYQSQCPLPRWITKALMNGLQGNLKNRRFGIASGDFVPLKSGAHSDGDLAAEARGDF